MMLIDLGASPVTTAQGRWYPMAFSAEALIVLVFTAVLVQLRFSSLLPRIALYLAKGFSMLHSSDCESTKQVLSDGKKSEILQSEPVEPESASLDWEPARRRRRALKQREIQKILGISSDEDVRLKISEGYEINKRGVEIFHKSWLPASEKPKAAICFCHGYGDTCTFFFEVIARRLAIQGFAVFGMDYAGSGLSGGLHGFIPHFDHVVQDVIEHFSSIRECEEFKGLPLFLMGESMGGAVALKAHLKKPKGWDGAVLIAPMCKIAEDMYPPWYLVELLKLAAKFIPKAKLVPSGDIAEIGFRDIQKRSQAMQNAIAYTGKPRLGTAVSLLRATEDLEGELHKVSMPLLILHGAADRVTDPAISKALYERASTADKTLHLYENAWHAVLAGEPDDMVDRVMDDIVKWLDARSLRLNALDRGST